MISKFRENGNDFSKAILSKPERRVLNKAIGIGSTAIENVRFVNNNIVFYLRSGVKVIFFRYQVSGGAV